MASVEIEPQPDAEPTEEQMDATQEPMHREEVKVEEAWWKDTKIWINLIGYIAVTAALVIIKVRPDIMPHSERGYPCKEPSLMYPSRPESVRQRTLIVSTISILLMSVFISEGLYSISPEYHTQRSMEALGEVPLKDKVFLFINLVTSKLLYGYLGLMLTMDTTYILQHLTSGHRPDFLKTCNPKASVCDSKIIGFPGDCQQPDMDLLKDSRMSFPSEYASISFYMTVFSVMIIERAFSADFFALKIAVQSSYIFWAMYLSVSRVNDNKNHPVDTFAGCFLGTSVAFITDYLATYQDYQDAANYDPSNITLNIQDWEEAEQPIDDQGEQGRQYQYT